MGYCKNCKFWNDGQCERVDNRDEGFGWSQNPAIRFEVEIKADDDSGLGYRLITGPDFGCVRFEEKISDLGD